MENTIDIETEREETVSFEDLGLDEYTLKAVGKKGFTSPSPIQILAIPRLLNGESNLIAKARTGTGKTAAFSLPIIQSIREKTEKIQALILEPTRELAIQTCTEIQSFSTNAVPRTTVLYGGASYSNQIRDLKKGCEIVVGTPGRIKDHLDRKTLDISQIKYFILDEGDEMLDMGFIDDIREIFGHANPDSRILLFSATMPPAILKIAADFMGEYDIIEEAKVVDEPLLIEQKYYILKEFDKLEALVRIIDISTDFYGLIFTMTKAEADSVAKELIIKGYDAAALHGDIMQQQREKILELFRIKKTKILVATDVAARGIDITGLSHVINYSLPYDTATYVHRIGRTGRAGTTGTAITFVRPEEKRKLRFFLQNAQKATKGKIQEEEIPSVSKVIKIKEENLINELKQKLFKKYKKTEDNGDNPPEQKELKTFDDKFIALAQSLVQNNNAEQILAGVLSVFYGSKLSSKNYGKITKIEATSNKNQTRIFVSLGKKDGYRAKEIAAFFSKLCSIPQRLVDDIDVTQQFSIVSLPKDAAKTALALSKSRKDVPHMHIDTKDGGRGSRKNRNRNQSVIENQKNKKTEQQEYKKRKSDKQNPKTKKAEPKKSKKQAKSSNALAYKKN
ncbi:MAG: DEAD/DEAH box helicase [Treponema sp.]|nr:DEAD/DEAH box helicase [Treponema sp.]